MLYLLTAIQNILYNVSRFRLPKRYLMLQKERKNFDNEKKQREIPQNWLGIK